MPELSIESTESVERASVTVSNPKKRTSMIPSNTVQESWPFTSETLPIFKWLHAYKLAVWSTPATSSWIVTLLAQIRTMPDANRTVPHAKFIKFGRLLEYW
eukprot:578744-Amphidinium_carterae.1